MRFWKMNGAGNDFIMINNIEEQLSPDIFPVMARLLCERHMSLGADGLMIIEKPSAGIRADFRMLFFNSDGSPGEMCGNGARCIARYGYETGLSGARQTIETTAGIVTGERIDSSLYRIRLNDPGVIELERKLTVASDTIGRIAAVRQAVKGAGGAAHGSSAAGYGRHEAADAPLTISCSYMELGRPGIPHVIVEYGGDMAVLCGSSHLADADEDVLRELGQSLRYESTLPKGANVNFIEITGTDKVLIRTYERGVEDFTYACGTGTGSAAAALTLKGKLSGSGMSFNMRGGTLIVDIEETDECDDGSLYVHGIMLTGPTNIVATGEIRDSALASCGIKL